MALPPDFISTSEVSDQEVEERFFRDQFNDAVENPRPRAYTYNLGQDYGSGDNDYASYNPYWITAIIRLGNPLSFSRQTMSSISNNLASGALLRNESPLIITDDCLGMNISRSKTNHLSSMNLNLVQTDINYLKEILPGDWVMSWILNNREDYLRVLTLVELGEPANGIKDGFKFLGRIHDVRKSLVQDPRSGTRSSSYSIQSVGFQELDSQFFYDNSLSSKDKLKADIGQWLTRIGVHYEQLFSDITGGDGIAQNNINKVIPTLVDLIIGQGPPDSARIDIKVPTGIVNATPQINTAPYSYCIPTMVCNLLGKKPSKGGDVAGYSDILELLQGVQKYDNKANSIAAFIPKLKESNFVNRRVCEDELLGTFISFMPDFCNRPLWQVMQQYLNPTINEMYTTLRVNPKGQVVPTLVLRQIPFTTDSFERDNLAYTRFLDMPRWKMPGIMVEALDIGRSNSTRANFIHIYGASSYLAKNQPIPYQIVENPPIMDNIDIMRSGLRSHMATVECWTSDQVGLTPRKWIELVADWMIGSHLTLNGSIRCKGIQAPIALGDNLEFDGVVYHIESITDNCHIDGRGVKVWNTTMTLTNGMNATGGVVVSDNENGLVADDNVSPIYPGITNDSNRSYDPGITLDGRRTSGGESNRTPSATGEFDRVDDRGGSKAFMDEALKEHKNDL